MTKQLHIFDWEHEPVQGRANRPVNEAIDSGVPSGLDKAWELRRGKLSVRDRTLSSHSIAWLASLPPELRPSELGKKFPRLVNRLALCWPDKSLVKLVLKDLTSDKRRNRKGFPAEIKHELSKLSAELSRGLITPPLTGPQAARSVEAKLPFPTESLP